MRFDLQSDIAPYETSHPRKAVAQVDPTVYRGLATWN